MSYNALYAKAFKYGMMFDKDIKPGMPVGISVIEIDDVLLAVKKAYVDMSPRTFKSKDSQAKQALNPKKKECLFRELAEKIADYMQNGTEDFDDWHKKICEFFIDRFAEILRDADKNPQDATYGKAQKIVNMTFKYLYCYDDAMDYEKRFEPCHMALDSYILNWVMDQFNKELPKNKRFSKSGARHLPTWSSLKYEMDESGVPQYIEIQAAIKEWSKKPRIEAEFEIWYHERNK